MKMIQSIYIFILNSIYTVTGKLNQKVRSCIIYLTIGFFIGLSIYNYIVHPNGAFLPKFERDFIGCLCLAIIALMSIEGKMKKMEWNRQFLFIWYGLAFLIFISAFLHPIENSYWLWSISMLIGFPGLYLIWQNRGDYDTLYKIVSYIVSMAILICFVICLLTVSREQFISGRYSSIMSNANHLGKLAVAGVTASLYLFSIKKGKWIYLLPGGISLCLAFLCASRTALLIIVVQGLIFAIWESKICERKYKILCAFAILYVIAAISEKGLMYCMYVRDADNTKVMGMNIRENKGEELKVRTASVGGIREIEKEEEVADQPTTSDILENRFSMEGKDLNQISSGRIDTWRYYLSKLNFEGNDWNKHIKSKPVVNRAHNDIIEVAFRSGIVAGFFDFLFFLYMGIYVLQCVVSKKIQNKWTLFTVLAITAYIGYSMLEIIAYPFRVHYVFMAYISLIPLFDRKSELKMVNRFDKTLELK